MLKLKSSQVSHLLKRPKVHGLIKKDKNSYKYYLTRLGKETIIMGQKLKEFVIIPAFNA
jgi:predicted transcriptional regulator